MVTYRRFIFDLWNVPKPFVYRPFEKKEGSFATPIQVIRLGFEPTFRVPLFIVVLII
jgi:hypothetical protein